jgi:hypothetical protein
MGDEVNNAALLLDAALLAIIDAPQQRLLRKAPMSNTVM